MSTDSVLLEASLSGLPSEILLEILTSLDYDPTLEANLKLVSRRFKEVTQSYEHCIASSILKSQFAWAPRQFPGLFATRADGRQPGWKELATIFHRTATLSHIKSQCKVIREGNGEHSAWTTCRALTFHHAGLLLLYRLADCDTHEAKAALLQSLPRSSLAVLLFTLMVSVHLLRAIGPQMTLYWTDPPLTEESRSDIELACEELLLRDGPSFLLGLLMHKQESIHALKTEVLAIPSRESNTDGVPPPTTLIATMRQMFSAKVKCEMRYNLVHMWYVLDEECTDLASADDRAANEALERIVNGEEILRVCERCRLMGLHGPRS